MNQSKKILAALAAVPVSVVVADGVMATENTLSFEIKNDFLEGKAVSVTSQGVDGNFQLEIINNLKGFGQNFTLTRGGKTKELTKTEIENIINNLKADLNANIELYGLIEKMKITIVESGEAATLKSTVKFEVNYLANTATLDSVLDDTNLETKLGIPSSPSPIQKIKAVHDYLINKTNFDSSAHALVGLTAPSKLSAHSYSLWTYLLLKKLGVEVQYVYGISDGKYQPWNMVEIDGKWYHLDVAKNEVASTSTYISYQYFLTSQFNENNLLNKPSEPIGNYPIFETITNSIQVGTKLYYVDESDGNFIKSIDLNQLGTDAVKLNHTTRKEHLILDSTNNVLYFIDYTAGKTLYQIDSNGVIEQVVNESIKSLSYDKALKKLKYTTEANKTREIVLTSGNDSVTTKSEFDLVVINKLKKAIDNMPPENPTTAQRQNLIELYYALTSSQKNVFELNAAYYNELRSHIAAMDSGVIEVVKAIDNLADSRNWAIETINDAITKYNNLGNMQSQVVNASILNYAKEQLALYNDVLTKLPIFLGKYATANSKTKEFYTELDVLEKNFALLEPELVKILTKETDFAVSNFKNLIIEKNEDIKTVKQFTDKLNALDEILEDFISSTAILETDYNTLKNNIALFSLLTNTDLNKITNYLTNVEKMQAVIAEFGQKDYIAKVATIENTAISPTPTPLELAFIKDIERVKELIDAGIKPSQWKALSVTNSVDFIEKVNGFLERVAKEQENLAGAAIKVKSKLEEFNQGILLNLNESTNAQDYVNKFNTLKSELEGSAVAGTAENLEIILAKPELKGLAEIWKRHVALSADFVSNVNTFKGNIATLKADANHTEAEVDQLLVEYNALDPIIKHYITNFADLETMKKAFAELKDQNEAQILINKIDNLLLKHEISAVTYVETKALWDQYENGSVIFKETVELASNFADFETLWQTLDTEDQKIKVLIKEIKELSNDSTKEQIDAVKAKYDALTEEQQKLITNYSDLEKLLAMGDQLAVRKVIEMIATLTDESTRAEIEAVRAAYEALSDEAKALIPDRTLEILAYFESRLAELSEIAQKEAAVIQDRINRITSNYTEAQIKNIRIAYNALSELAKTYVTNLQTLINAENNVIYQNTVVKQAKLDANAFDVYMNDITRNSTTAQIAQARANYNRLSAEARKHVTTYEKLVRLETMWKDPEYLDLVFTYYPEYIHEVKPGAIVVQKPTYDPLYIPDDSATKPTPTYPAPSIATNPVASWSAYETMRYQNGRYSTTISSTQVKNNTDRNMRLKADNIEIVIPTVDLKVSTATVGVSVNVANNQLNIQFTEGNNAKYFSDYVEIHVPFSALKGNASQIIERVSAFGSAASFKVDGSTFIIRTKSSGTFKATTARTYNDIPSGAQGDAIRELAKRGIQFNTTSRLSQSHKQVTKMDVALMIATALDLSSNAKSKYQDLESDVHVKRAQGLLEAGIMSGATSSRFNPNGTITKQAAAIIIANMYRYLNQDLAKAYSELNSSYRDVAGLTLEAKQSIAILELFGVVSGTGSFEPTKQLTRGEFAEIIYKALTAIDYL